MKKIAWRKNLRLSQCFLTLLFSVFSIQLPAQTERSVETEKQEAMKFLKQNMEGCFSLAGEGVSNYYAKMNGVFCQDTTLGNDEYRMAYRSALHTWPFHPEKCDTLYDSKCLTTEFLMSNINDAYRMWKRNGRLFSFETFCNYILPYRINHEPVSDWRNAYIKRYGDVIRPYFVCQYNYFHAFSIHNMLNKGFNGAVYYPTGPVPEFSLADLLDVKLGNCESYSARSVALLRAFGIPATMDFVPQWGNRSMGHSWAVMFINDKQTLPFGQNEALGAHFDERPELTLPKIYRHTFARQEWLKEISTDDDPYIPALFRSQRYSDVTDAYVETSDITISIKDRKWLDGVKWLYLAVFDNREWIPVAFSRISKNATVSFLKVGRGIAYIPFYYDAYGRRHYASPPFILDNEGRIIYQEADMAKARSVTVTRKYRESETLRKYNKQLQGGKIVVSNDKDFCDSLIVAVIDSITENRFHSIRLDYSGQYKYLKYISPRESYGNIAEIEMYNDADSLLKPVHCFGGRGAWIEHSPAKVFDGNELTSYSRLSPDGAWAAAELAAPAHISKIRIHPRTDGNAVYAGDVYRLCYWGDGRWNVIGERKAEHEDTLTFAGVPENALLLLRNTTRGREERIFTYSGGRQIWW